VIFDRVREYRKIYKTENLISVMNRSINDTLSRTFITAGTVFMTLLVLLVFGGEVNRGFSFALLIGIITGTYSTIYVAGSIVIDWNIFVRKQPLEVALAVKKAKVEKQEGRDVERGVKTPI
jgi:SecD/SecF fusion protein